MGCKNKMMKCPKVSELISIVGEVRGRKNIINHKVFVVGGKGYECVCVTMQDQKNEMSKMCDEKSMKCPVNC